jgi:CDP-diacylglycerol--glycerol-3-phosphate 3-phosphatidyltransferase
MRDRCLKSYYNFVEKLIRPQIHAFFSPNIVSLLALASSFAAGILYGGGFFFAGGVVLLFSGFLDTLDGTIARLTNVSTRFGALLDSVLDRYADFFILTGFLIYYRYKGMFFVILLVILGSFMVSYVKARAESLGKIRVIGLMQRPERVLLIVVGSFLTLPVSWYFPNYKDVPIVVVLYLLAILTNITSLHRLFAAKKDFSQS